MLIPDDLEMELDEFVERYEMACASGREVDVAAYLPPQQHPRYAQITCELLRVHMELSGQRGQFISAEDCRRQYPEVCAQSLHFKALQAEEERVRASSRASQLAASTGSVSANAPGSSQANGRAEMPKPGQTVCGFQLVAELGRGAFSQVFLAKDGSLSQRSVVLKISAKLLGEADLLSRLQHKNIVPVYSLHKYGQYHLICMPFLGTMTLADMLSAQPQASSAMSGKALISTLAAHASRTWKEDESHAIVEIPSQPATEQLRQRGLSSQLATEVSRMSTTELALWIVSELADGLTHAHQRGVLHRDIKPANVLLSDDGLPMLLDFNLAASTKPQDASHQVVGGTLRYMSPEQLRAVQNQRSTPDARADVFSLGVVLYELLHRRAPYPDRTGGWNEVLEQMLVDRQSPPIALVDWREGLTPAVVSILNRTLAFEPQNRYQSASELRDDLRAHLQSRPLPTAKDRSIRERVRKWNALHPRLSSMTIAAVLGFLVLGGGSTWAIQRQGQMDRLRASQWLTQLEHAQSDARTLLASDYAPASAIQSWLQQSANVLAPDVKGLLNKLDSDQVGRARQCLGRLHFYRARGAIGMSARETNEQKQRWMESALSELQLAQSYEHTELASAWQDNLERAAGHLQGSAPIPENARFKVDAMTLRRELAAAHTKVHAEASNPWHWVSIGQMQLELGQLDAASSSFRLGHNLAESEPVTAFFLGLIDMKLKRFAQADHWFTLTLAQDPNCWEAWLNRAATRVELGRFTEAVADIEALGEHIQRYPRAWFIREIAETRLGNMDAALQSRLRGLKQDPTDALSWNARGQARLRHKPADAPGALADFDRAINLDPQLRNAYENAAHVLSERLGQPQAAIDRLSEVLKIDPEYALAWSSRAVLFARQGDFSAASDDVEHALRLDRSPMICYQCASALALSEAASPADQAASAEKQKLAEPTNSMQLLKETLRKDASLSRFMRKDQDLRALLNNNEFQELLKAAARLE